MFLFGAQVSKPSRTIMDTLQTTRLSGNYLLDGPSEECVTFLLLFSFLRVIPKPRLEPWDSHRLQIFPMNLCFAEDVAWLRRLWVYFGTNTTAQSPPWCAFSAWCAFSESHGCCNEPKLCVSSQSWLAWWRRAWRQRTFEQSLNIIEHHWRQSRQQENFKWFFDVFWSSYVNHCYICFRGVYFQPWD